MFTPVPYLPPPPCPLHPTPTPTCHHPTHTGQGRSACVAAPRDHPQPGAPGAGQGQEPGAASKVVDHRTGTKGGAGLIGGRGVLLWRRCCCRVSVSMSGGWGCDAEPCSSTCGFFALVGLTGRPVDTSLASASAAFAAALLRLLLVCDACSAGAMSA